MKHTLLHFLVAIYLFLFSNPNYAQAPDLGAVGDFVLFTTTGAVGNNSSNSIYTGNIGTNNGAITIDVNVNGVIHNADDVTTAAANDLLTAYNQLNTTLTTVTRPSGLLGGGEVLTTGVYAISELSTLNGILSLDGQEDPNAVFIFKIGAAFSTGTSAQVILTNGTQACNVFWKVEGVIDIGFNSTMKGTLIANNAAINLSSGVYLEGRALSTTGAVNSYGIAAAIPTGCGRAVLTGPTAPNLATAACYALFTGNGSVTGDNASVVTGDIGTNAGITTGFDPLKVNGMIHAGPDVSTNACNIDLATANTNLANLPVDIELLYPAKFGGGLELTPHTYLLDAATALTGTVILNAEGNGDAVFVIKINGAFSSAVNAQVQLINGAKSSNVFWRIVGAVSLGANTQFKGTIVCNGGEVNLSSGGIELDGRALTVTGAFSTIGVNAIIPASTCSILPLSWLYFSGKSVDKNVVLKWGTAREVNNKLFTIERSSDSRSFETLATIMVDQKVVNPVYEYSFTDQKPLSVGYYRLSQTDIDGTRDYYKTIQVKLNVNAGFRAVNYIRANYIYIQASGALPGNGSIELYNIEGRKMSSQKIMLTKEESTYKLEKPLSKGLYLLNINSSGVNLYHGKVMVQ
ncbi:MAG: ice-binding family protein [Chitinophagaceae bacterium]